MTIFPDALETFLLGNQNAEARLVRAEIYLPIEIRQCEIQQPAPVAGYEED